MLDAHQLNIFLVAAETLNFTQAAGHLHMSQPSVSQHIRALEQHFDEELFVRQGRSLKLTDAGKILVPLARQFVRQSTCIDEAMASLQGQIQGKIFLGCNAESGKYVLPKFFRDFHAEYPDVTISCQTDCSQSPLDELLTGKLHFMITNQDPDPNPCLDYHQFSTEEITLITPLDHPLADRETVNLDDIEDEYHILHEEDSWTFQKINRSLSEHDYSLLMAKSFLSLSNTEAIVLSVGRGLGVGFCSRVIADALGKVKSIPIEGVTIEQGFSIVRNLNQPSSAARDAFWHFMTQASDEIKQYAEG